MSSKKAREIKKAVKETRTDNIGDLLKKYDDKSERDFIQKYAETEIAVRSMKIASLSYLLALILFVVAVGFNVAIVTFPDSYKQNYGFFMIGIIVTFAYLIYEFIKIVYEKVPLQNIIIEIEDVNKLKGKTEEEKMDLNDEKIDENENCPLSVESWIIILNDEIRNLKYPNLKDTLNPILIASIAFIGFMIASFNTPLLSLFSSIMHPIWIVFGVLISIGVIAFLISYLDTRKKIKSYDIIKKKIIFGELTDSNKIREDWMKVVASSNVMLIFFRNFFKK